MQKLKLNSKGNKGIDDFINKCKGDNLADETIASYKNAWKQFQKYYIGDINNVKQEDVDNFKEVRKSQVSLSTVNTNLRHLRAIFNYFDLEIKIKLLSGDVPKKKPYKMEDMEKLLAKPKTKDFMVYRNWVIINTIFDVGARIKTLLNITIEDVDFEDNTFFFRHLKNKSTAVMPFSQYLANILKEYIAVRGGSGSDFLFPNAYGKQAKSRDIWYSIKTYNNARGVTTTGIHRFRHTFAKQFARNGGDLFTLQYKLTQKDISQTIKYVEMLGEDVRHMGGASPLEMYKSSKSKIKMKKK